MPTTTKILGSGGVHYTQVWLFSNKFTKTFVNNFVLVEKSKIFSLKSIFDFALHFIYFVLR